jgi:hypothetical protein
MGKVCCDSGNIEEDYRWKTECGGRDIPEAQSLHWSHQFIIKMRNELQGSDATLFTGKMKRAKAHSTETGPKAVNKFVYPIDHNWNFRSGMCT